MEAFNFWTDKWKNYDNIFMQKQNNGNFTLCFNNLKKTEQSCQKVDLSFHLFLVLC